MNSNDLTIKPKSYFPLKILLIDKFGNPYQEMVVQTPADIPNATCFKVLKCNYNDK